MKRIHLMTAAIAIGASYSSASGSLIELEASNHMGMRWHSRTCDPQPLNGMTINWGEPEHNRGFEDRTFLVYDLSGFDDPEIIQSAILNLGIQNQDPGGPIGIIDVSTDWLSDDELPPEAFWWGGSLLSFPANDSRRIYEVEVTQFVREGMEERIPPFAFFRLSTDTLDRYIVGPAVSFPVPTLTIRIPEPTTVCVLGLPAMVRLIRRDRSS